MLLLVSLLLAGQAGQSKSSVEESRLLPAAAHRVVSTAGWQGYKAFPREDGSIGEPIPEYIWVDGSHAIFYDMYSVIWELDTRTRVQTKLDALSQSLQPSFGTFLSATSPDGRYALWGGIKSLKAGDRSWFISRLDGSDPSDWLDLKQIRGVTGSGPEIMSEAGWTPDGTQIIETALTSDEPAVL